MSYRTIATLAAAAVIGIACVSTEAFARGGGRAGGARAGGVHAGAVHGGAVHRGAYARRGVGVGVGAAAVGAGVYYNRSQCGYYPNPPCY